MTIATLPVYSKQSWLLGLATKTILIKNVSVRMGESNSSLHGSFSAQIGNYLLTAFTEFARSTTTTTNKNLRNK